MFLLEEGSSSIFESLYEGVLVADSEGVVRYVNQSNLRITGLKLEDILNKPVEVIRPGSMLTQVIKSGKAIRHLRRKVGKSEYFANLVPIIVEGKIQGGVSISSEITDVQELLKQIKASEVVISQLQSAVNQLNQARYSFKDIIGVSEITKNTITKAKKIATAQSPVLIIGESGTGKELFAQAIHIDFGEFIILTYSGEVTSAFARKIRKELQVPVMIIGYEHDHISYTVEHDNYGKCFESYVSSLPKGVADKLNCSKNHC